MNRENIEILDWFHLPPCNMANGEPPITASVYIVRDKSTGKVNVYMGYCEDKFPLRYSTLDELAEIIAYGDKVSFDEFYERINNIHTHIRLKNK